MLKAWKSYWAFTNGIYKVVVLVVMPVLLTLIQLLLLKLDIGFGLEMFLILYYLDTIADHFFMSGFYSKNNSSFEFMQTSSRFSKLAKEVVSVDVIRRVLLYQLPYFVTFVWSLGEPEAMEWCKMMASLPWMLTLTAQIVVLISRHYTVWNNVYACSAVGLMVLCVFMIPIFFFAISRWTLNLFLMVGVVIAGVGTYFYTDKKVRESYYDK